MRDIDPLTSDTGACDTYWKGGPAMQKIERFAPLLGRIFLAFIFLMSGLEKIGNWDQTAGYMASKEMPMIPLFLVGAIFLEVLGGLSVLLGWKARVGAAGLLVFLVPTTLIFHNFWALEGMEQQAQMINFLKNLAILGGLFLILGLGPGSLSINDRCKGTGG